MEKEVLRTVKKYNLISEGDSVIVGLSGGADSVSLLLCLLKLKEHLGIREIFGVHINHSLRPTADRDEEFSKKLCEKLNVPFYSKKIDIKGLKEELSLCEEEAGRIARYRFFNKVREFTGANKIATAHNKNDCTETFFIRLLRGGGSESLSGIKPKREDGVIRPLINTSRESILRYLDKLNQEYMTDETNLTTEYLRNKIRINLIPYLKEEFFLKDEGVVSISDSLREDSEYIKEEAEKILKKATAAGERITFLIDDIKNLHSALLKRVFQSAIIEISGKSALKDTLYNIINIVKKGETGKKVVISSEFEAIISYDTLIFKRKEEKREYCYQIKEGDSIIEEINCIFTLSQGECKGKMSINLPEFKELKVRTRKNGDRMLIKNTGTKKLKDIFIDRKIPKDKRDIYPIVEMDGEIIWIPDLYKREFENCKYNLKIKWENGYEK